eukprot:gene25102-biopygen17975
MGLSLSRTDCQKVKFASFPNGALRHAQHTTERRHQNAPGERRPCSKGSSVGRTGTARVRSASVTLDSVVRPASGPRPLSFPPAPCCCCRARRGAAPQRGRRSGGSGAALISAHAFWSAEHHGQCDQCGKCGRRGDAATPKGSQDTGAGMARATGIFWLGWRGHGAGMVRAWPRRTRTGRGPHDRSHRDGRGPDAGRTIEVTETDADRTWTGRGQCCFSQGVRLLPQLWIPDSPVCPPFFSPRSMEKREPSEIRRKQQHPTAAVRPVYFPLEGQLYRTSQPPPLRAAAVEPSGPRL